MIVSTVSAGDMSLNAAAHRALFFSSLGVDPSRVVSFRQTHSKDVAVAEPDAGRTHSADGGVTSNREMALAITVADCLPIALLDVRRGCFGIVHSGWKGTGIVLNAVALMGKHFGSHAADITAVIGPGIGACCYDVPSERGSLFSPLDPKCLVARDGKHYLDLKLANRALLASAGVREISTSDICTNCAPEFGSFRREGPCDFTRMVAAIGFF